MKKDIVLHFLHKVTVRDIDTASHIVEAVAVCEEMTAFDFHGNYDFLDQFVLNTFLASYWLNFIIKEPTHNFLAKF